MENHVQLNKIMQVMKMSMGTCFNGEGTMGNNHYHVQQINHSIALEDNFKDFLRFGSTFTNNNVRVRVKSNFSLNFSDVNCDVPE
jgi:hypothetical protein